MVTARIAWAAAMVKWVMRLVRGLHTQGLSKYCHGVVGVPRQNTRRSPFCRGLPFKGVERVLIREEDTPALARTPCNEGLCRGLSMVMREKISAKRP